MQRFLFLGELQKKAVSLVSDNASAVLTAGGVVGTVTTAVLTGRAAVKAKVKIDAAEKEAVDSRGDLIGTEDMPYRMPNVDRVKLTGVYFIPPVLVGGATIGSIIWANRMSAQKAAALAAAYGLAEGRLNEYKEKVSEKLSPAKQQQVADELAQQQVDRTSGDEQIVIVDGESLVLDAPTGRYFRSDMETIRRAVNSLNAEIQNHGYANAQYFYDEIGLDETTWTTDVGWGNTGQLVELSYSTTLKNGKPVLVIDFNRVPSLDYMQDYE